MKPRTRPIDFGPVVVEPEHVASRTTVGEGRNSSSSARTATGPPRAAAPVRLREGLVQVVVDDVEAHVAGAREADDRVEVRAVVVEERSVAVEDRGDLLDALVEEPERRGVREHQAGSALVDLRAQVVEVEVARSVVATFASSKPAIVTLAGLVPCAVSAVTITFPRLAAIRERSAHDHQPGELALRARRLQRDGRQPRDLGEDLLELPFELERALDAVLLLQRVKVAEAGEGDDALVDARVVLHRAAAERVEAGVDAEVAIGELVK